MIQIEEGNKENNSEKVNFVDVVAICNDSVDGIILDEELQPEVIIPEIHLLQDQSSEINEDTSTMPDSKNICQKIISDIIEDITAQEDDTETLCHGILLDILEQIEKRPPSSDHGAGTDNQILNDNHNPDEIHLIHVEEIVVQEVPSMQENIFHEGELFLGLGKQFIL